jgi:hypothetical protein
MGELLDKLERASRGTVQPLGFGGAAKRQKVAPILLLGAVTAGDDAQAKLAVEGGVDGAIVVARNGQKQTDVQKSMKALGEVTSGVWQDEASPNDPEGSDFQVFSSDATPLGSLGGDERTNVMHVVPDLDDSLLRTLEYLPVDAFLVSLTDADKLTVGQLMRIARVRGATSRWLLAHLAMLPVKEELEQLRDAGVGGIVVDVASREAKDLQAVKETLLELSHESPNRKKHHRDATLPTSAMQGPEPSRRPAPEPEPDDDDWDDE